MLKKDGIIYNLEYIVCLPASQKHLYDSLNYTFGNIYLFENNRDEIEIFKKFIKTNNIKQVIFIDYLLEFKELLMELRKEIPIVKFIFTKEISSLSESYILTVFNGMMDLYDSNFIDAIGFVDYNLYHVLKQKKNIYHIQLDIDVEKKGNDKKRNIGLISEETDPKHSYYNALSAIKLIDETVNLSCKTQVTEQFIQDFKIKSKEMELKNILSESDVNLYINFTNNNYLLFLKSMDNGIPCILGNQQIIEKNYKLFDLITVKSDDDVTEISEKIKFVKKNKKEILKEYEIFRKKYSDKVKQLKQEFLGIETEEYNETESELLLSVVVPIYNVEKYLEKSINSIIKAKIDNMEILLINDGSTDNSEEIALKYAKKYPELIKYHKQTNHGLGNVRNVGLKLAKGKYIASIDSDDTVNPNFFKEAVESMKNNVDIIMCDWLSINENTGEKFITSAKDYIFNNINYYHGLLYTSIMPSTCNKIVKKSLYKNINLQFVENLKYEDLGTNPIILLKAKTIKYIQKPYYEYMIRNNSIMRTKIGTDMIDILGILNNRIEKHIKLTKEEKQKFLCYTFFWRIEESILNPFYELPKEEQTNYINYIYDNLLDIFKEVYENEYVIKKINEFPSHIKEFILKRNKSIIKKSLEKFIKENEKENVYKITACDVYYGIK